LNSVAVFTVDVEYSLEATVKLLRDAGRTP
jgi:hypothetical protein